jgi:MFS transporter, YNFM family, putative membrane transport protein
MLYRKVFMSAVYRGTNKFIQINLAFFAAGFVTFVTLYDLQPLLPVFSEEFAVSAALGSLPLSVATCTMAVTMLLAGTLSETWGRKRIMTAAMFITSTIAILTAFSETFSTLVILRLFQGIALAGLPAVAMAYLSEEMDSSALGSAMGLYIAGNAAGGMTGRIFTATVTDYFSWRTALCAIGLICLLASIYFARTLPASANFQTRPFHAGYLYTSLMQNLRNRGLLYLYSIVFMLMGSFVTLFNYITFRLLNAPYNLSQTLISWIFLVYLLGSFSSTMAGHLASRYKRGHILLSSLLIMISGALFTLFSNLALIIFGIAVFTIGFFSSHTTASSWVGAQVKTARAQASSLYLFFYYLGGSVTGTLGGLFWSAYGWEGIIGTISLLLLLAIAITVRLTIYSGNINNGQDVEKGADDLSFSAKA